MASARSQGGINGDPLDGPGPVRPHGGAPRARGAVGLKGRIVFICPGLTEPGGTARRSRLIAEGLAASGWEVRVITRSGILRRVRVERGERLLVIELPGFGLQRVGGLLFYLLATPLALAWGLRAQAFLALQLLSTTTVAALCARLLRKPYVAMASTSGELSESRYISQRRTAPIRRRLLARAQALVAQTPQVAEELTQFVAADRVAVLPNPVQLIDNPPPLSGRPRVLFAGRLSVEKDLIGLISAWRTVLAATPDAQLTIVGEGGAFRSVEPELRRLVGGEPALAGSVEMPGWAASIGPFFADHDVFVLPSLEEGMSNALLEACAWGRIPVASAIAGNVAILGADHPLLFEAGDHEQLAAALLEALAAPLGERELIRTALQTRVRREFAREAIIARLEELICADSARNQYS